MRTTTRVRLSRATAERLLDGGDVGEPPGVTAVAGERAHHEFGGGTAGPAGRRHYRRAAGGTGHCRWVGRSRPTHR